MPYRSRNHMTLMFAISLQMVGQLFQYLLQIGFMWRGSKNLRKGKRKKKEENFSSSFHIMNHETNFECKGTFQFYVSR